MSLARLRFDTINKTLNAINNTNSALKFILLPPNRCDFKLDRKIVSTNQIEVGNNLSSIRTSRQQIAFKLMYYNGEALIVFLCLEKWQANGF